MFKKIKSDDTTLAASILAALIILMILFNQFILCYIFFILFIAVGIYNMRLKIKEGKEYDIKVYETYQAVENLTLKELVEDIKKSENIDTISINYLRKIIRENEKKKNV